MAGRSSQSPTGDALYVLVALADLRDTRAVAVCAPLSGPSGATSAVALPQPVAEQAVDGPSPRTDALLLLQVHC